MVKTFRYLLCVLAVALTNAGCIQDGLDDCFTTALIYITVSEGNGLERSSNPAGNVDNATVYIFGDDLQLERTVQMSREDIENRVPVEITYLDGHKPRVVVWGNLNGSQEVSPAVPGLLLSEAEIRLLQNDGYSLPPDNLYYGLRELSLEPVQEVAISIWVGRISIAVHGIEDVINTASEYFFTVESKCNGYDFYGVPKEDNALIHIEGEVDEQQEELLSHRPVNLIAYPSEPQQPQTLIVRLYRKTDTGNQLLATADTDILGNSIIPQPGMNTNVLIRLTEDGNMEVRVEITPWDYVHQWVIW